MRDNDKGIAYGAEQEVRVLLDNADKFSSRTVEIMGSTLTLPIERRFGDVEGVQRYCDALLALGPVRARWGSVRPVIVRKRRGHAKAHYEYNGAVIAIPDHSVSTGWALRELVAIHELAHHLTGPGHGHDKVFFANFTELAEIAMGAEIGFLLRVLHCEMSH